MRTFSNDRLLLAKKMQDMRNELEQMQSENIIDEALTLGKTRIKEERNVIKKIDELEQHKKLALDNYLTSIKGKSVKEITKEFKKK